MKTTCQQMLAIPFFEGARGSKLELCGQPCEFRYSKKLRKVGASASTFKYCAVHRRLRRLYGKDDPRTMRPAKHIEERKES